MPLTFHKTVWALFFLLASIPFAFCQQQNSLLLLDDFESYPLNALDQETDVFDSSAVLLRQTLKDHAAFCHQGKSLSLGYDLSDDNAFFCGAVSFLPGTDLSAFRYLSFRVRGKAGGEYFLVEMERANGEIAKVAVWNYLPCGPSTDWQKVVIPLDAFWNLTSLTDMVKFTIVFDRYTCSTNQSPLSGEVHFDDFLFGTFFPGYVRLDPFGDLVGSNATGGNNGDFSDTTLGSYWSETVCAQTNCSCKLQLHYNNQQDEFGGAFFILGGGLDGWTPTGKNIPDYDSLRLIAQAPSSALNPGNFKIELKGNDTFSHQIFGVGLTEQVFSVPFAAFSPPVNPLGIKEFTVVFEQNMQEQPLGAVFLDEVELRAQGYALPDLEKPQPPGAVTLDGSPPQPSNLLPPGASFTIAATIDNNNPRLESLRLEYKADCNWVCLERKYAPLVSPQVSFAVEPEDAPENTWLEMRLVAENYNGCEAASEPFRLKKGENAAPVLPEALFRNAYSVFEFLRYENGVYTDAARFEPLQFHPASVATTGMGLIALCIADSMGWIDNAEALALQTLESMMGLHPVFKPERNCKGWFRHFLWQLTGERAWDSEFSSIDSGILTAGGLFCKKYFSGNDSIALLADSLYLSIDWESMIADPQSGGIFLTADSLGNGAGITLPFNEYMLVAWLAKNDHRQTGSAETLWNLHYETPDGLPVSDFMGIEVLTDAPGSFLSGFTHQFAWYLCHHYSTQAAYFSFFKNAMLKDSLWWAKNTECYEHIWGFGAGAANDWVDSGYNADNCLNHPGTICSPHIIAGFIPDSPGGLGDLLWLHDQPLGVYQMPDAASTPILWRFSTEDPLWRAGDVQGIDFSTMLLGIAAHPDFLGKAFFEQFNDFDFPAQGGQLFCVTSQREALPPPLAVAGQNFPNPFSTTTQIPLAVSSAEPFRLVIFDAFGKMVFEKALHFPQPGEHHFSWNGRDASGAPLPKGIYCYALRHENGATAARKMVVLE